MALMGVLAGALYGCEATHASETPLSTLSAHLAKALHGDAPRRSNTCLFNLFDKEVEPYAVVCIRRITLMRRMVIKFPYLQDAVSDAITTYSERGFPGTIEDTDDPVNILFAPIQGDPNRKSCDSTRWGRSPRTYLVSQRSF
jgi:hypothetical protein